MRLAETVTFGGSGLDRAAHLRGDPARIAALLARPGTGVLPIWRGKPMVMGEDQLLTPGWLAPGAAVFDGAGPPVFLGFDAGVARFARDVSSWAPEAGPETPDSFLDQSEQVHPLAPEGHRFAELRTLLTRLVARDAEFSAMAKAVLAWHVTHRFCATCGAESAVAEAGWQRLCPVCGAHHFPRTDPVVIMLITRGNKVLVGRSPQWPEGMYSLLAGFVEPGETIEAAVRREVLEEAGIEVGAIDYLSSQPWPFPMSLMFGCRGEALADEIRIDPVELDDALWMTREEMAQAMAGQHPVVKPARKGAIAHFLLRMWLADRLD